MEQSTSMYKGISEEATGERHSQGAIGEMKIGGL